MQIIPVDFILCDYSNLLWWIFPFEVAYVIKKSPAVARLHHFFSQG